MTATISEEKELLTSVADNIEAAVRGLKKERDTWRVVAEQYRAAFEAQSAWLLELQDICIATQAELENERIRPRGQDHLESHEDNQSYGTATIFRPPSSDTQRQPSSCFSRIVHFVSHCDYGTALVEVDHLLRGPLTPETRMQGLLLKSDILRKSDLLYDALAACSEALELCDRLAELHSYIPKTQYQRGVCYYQLSMAKQARDALSKVPSDGGSLYAKATKLRDSCEDQLGANRRSGFEYHRTPSEAFMDDVQESSFKARFPFTYLASHTSNTT